MSAANSLLRSYVAGRDVPVERRAALVESTRRVAAVGSWLGRNGTTVREMADRREASAAARRTDGRLNAS